LSKRLTFCNGEVILKNIEYSLTSNGNCFSPRNGEVILKEIHKTHQAQYLLQVSVPAMGK